MLLPAHVRMARAALGLSLDKLAQRSGVNPNTISRFEGGREVMSGVLRKLEAALVADGIIFHESADAISVTVPHEKLA